MPPAFQASYSDYVTGADGRAVAGATVALYPVDTFPAGTLPTTAPEATATATTDAAGRFLFAGLPPGDYHVFVRYTPPGGEPATAWRYGVAVAPYEAGRRTAAHRAGAAIPRTLAKLLGGLPVSVMCIGEGATLGYGATGTVSGGWVALLAARLAAAVPPARVTRYDPVDYATTLAAPIPGWTGVGVAAGAGPSPQQVSVINAAVSADTALRALRRAPNFTAASWFPPPDCYVILLGLAEMDSDPLTHVAADDLAAHLTGLVDALRANGAEALLCTPHVCLPPGDESYAAAVRSVAARGGCGLVDLRALCRTTTIPPRPTTATAPGSISRRGTTLIRPTLGTAPSATRSTRPSTRPARSLSRRRPGPAALLARRAENACGCSTPARSCSTAARGRRIQTPPSPRCWPARARCRQRTPGDRVTFSARCGEIYMLCRRWRDGGRVTVAVDGATLGTVDLYRALPQSTLDVAGVDGAIAPRDRVPLALGLDDTAHTMTLTLAGTADPAAQGTVWRFDALELLRLQHGGLAVEGTEPLQRVQRGAVAVALANAPTGTAAIAFPMPYLGAAPAVVAQSPDPAYYTVVGAVSGAGATVTLA